jgi:hypothetical protein
VKIAHIINPVKVAKNNELSLVQPITFQSINEAIKHHKGADITIYTTQYPEDHEIIPAEFIVLPDLERSISSIHPDLSDRKLPLIGDIIDQLKNLKDVDYFIYTNIDIALMPYFYDFVVNYLNKGHDALVINRRRITKAHFQSNNLASMYADVGKSHPGFDCFVFDKALLAKFYFDEICIGMPFIETSFIHNIIAHAKNPSFHTKEHLTFHIGFDVLNFKKSPLYFHNKKVFFERIQPELKPLYKRAKFPYQTLPFPLRWIKTILNPALFTRNLLELESKSRLHKIKVICDEIRWRILDK